MEVVSAGEVEEPLELLDGLDRLAVTDEYLVELDSSLDNFSVKEE
ncbi:hypothetical protein [Mesobacillus jeotgali]|nr:hypothetical protein [Mesobacillus jeotgali]